MRSLIEDERKQQEIEIPPDGISLDLLRAIYRNSSLPLTTRIRCAIAALPHEVPRLMVAAQVTENDFATLLDCRLERIKQLKAAPVIDAKASTSRNQTAIGRPQISPVLISNDAGLMPVVELFSVPAIGSASPVNG
jgi:hypothetical protein